MKSLFPYLRRVFVILLCAALFLGANAYFESSSGTAEATRVAPSSNGSPNWAGYVATDKSFTKVQAVITVPTVTCTVPGAESLFWVGFDGYNTQTVEQDGIAAKCNGLAPSYFAWWEMYNPTNGPLQQVPSDTVSVKPGQRINAYVSYAPVEQFDGETVGEYSLGLDNLSTNRSFSTEQSCASGYACNRTTAEWIAERYNLGDNTYTPLGQWASSNQLFADSYASASADTKLDSFTSYNSVAVSMLGTDTSYLAMADSPNTGGTSFGVSWNAAQ